MCDACEQPLRREIERLRRLTEQQADELAFVSGQLDGSRAVRACRDDAIATADAALDDAHTPRERDGRTLTLAERIAALLPWRAAAERAFRRLGYTPKTVDLDEEMAIALSDFDSEREWLRGDVQRLTKQRDNMERSLAASDAKLIAAHLALSEGGAPGGAAMGLVERIRAALPPLPEPAVHLTVTAAVVHGMPACGCVLTFVCRRCQREICACAGADDAALDLCDECAAAERQRRGDIDGR